MEEMKRLLIDVVMATLPMTTVTADLFIFSPPRRVLCLQVGGWSFHFDIRLLTLSYLYGGSVFHDRSPFYFF